MKINKRAFEEGDSGLGCCPGKVRGGTKDAFDEAQKLFFSVKSYQVHVAVALQPICIRVLSVIPALQIRTSESMVYYLNSKCEFHVDLLYSILFPKVSGLS